MGVCIPENYNSPPTGDANSVLKPRVIGEDLYNCRYVVAV